MDKLNLVLLVLLCVVVIVMAKPALNRERANLKAIDPKPLNHTDQSSTPSELTPAEPEHREVYKKFLLCREVSDQLGNCCIFIVEEAGVEPYVEYLCTPSVRADDSEA